MFSFGSGGGKDGKKENSGMFGDMMDKVKASADKLMDKPAQANASSEGAPARPQGTFLERINSSVSEVGASLRQTFSADEGHQHSHTHDSFAPQRTGNEVKWYVDGCSYFWAVSVALENARESIWILDWWLSPELYLRRPPAQNEPYRLDRLLRNAAERGVQVRIIVYKEVTQALSLSSSHTKHALEDLHPNITVLRHPDHLPDKQVVAHNFVKSFTNLSLTASAASKMPMDALKAIYGMNDDAVLYWAHHEKLCIVDGHLTFMGGLDMCYGRWDSYDHPIADVHPDDLNKIVFLGQDYNNARIMDFQDVAHWQNNKLDRKYNARMGWSDVTISLVGPVTEDLQAHFSQRWNFVYNEKYSVRGNKSRHQELKFEAGQTGIIDHGTPDEPQIKREHHVRDKLRKEYEEGRRKLSDRKARFKEHLAEHGMYTRTGPAALPGQIPCQIMRSCCRWSHGGLVEHSIADAYIQTIRESNHFIYIENQFFITATNDKQKPIRNRIGGAIVERIVDAHNSGRPYKVIVVIPAIPGFPGDLKADDALSTRAIMEFQYFSINRGGYSICEELAKQNIEPSRYIRFFNLRNYDRINLSSALTKVEEKSGIDYDAARRGADQRFGPGFAGNPAEKSQEPYSADPKSDISAYNAYQSAASNITSTSPDSITQCYLTPFPHPSSIPFSGPASAELSSYVSEELYVHTKLLIADDRTVLLGSANINDRSQLGTHDSEIAIRIDDPTTIESSMAGRPYRASKFASSLRRFITRKHLGLIEKQDYARAGDDPNSWPVNVEGNEYDWGSEFDQAVEDPLSASFTELWEGTATANTDAFEKVFHPVPSDRVRNWKDYDDYYGEFFPDVNAGKVEAGKEAVWKWGHVVEEEFAKGEEGLVQVRNELGKIRGTLVEMPLRFLEEEDIAKEGMALNAFTEEVYT